MDTLRADVPRLCLLIGSSRPQTNSVRRSRCARGEQDTRGDRVQAAGDGEEPVIQFGIDFLIGL
jgi:hypothetical protein